jgi:hypothetical protein
VGGQEIAGGKLVVGDAGTPATTDAEHDECAAQSGYDHVTGGAVGADGDAVFVPYSLDTWTGPSDAWVCVRAGLGARVMLDSSASGPFRQDEPTTPSPPRTPWTLGVVSAECEAQVGGTKTELVNAVIDGAQVWVTGWRSASKALLCVRAQDGSTSDGGRFLFDVTGTPGVQPVHEVGADTTGCTRNVFSNDTAGLAVRRSPDGAIPAAVCVTYGTTTTRLTAGYSGTADPPDIDWTSDN